LRYPQPEHPLRGNLRPPHEIHVAPSELGQVFACNYVPANLVAPHVDGPPVPREVPTKLVSLVEEECIAVLAAAKGVQHRELRCARRGAVERTTKIAMAVHDVLPDAAHPVSIGSLRVLEVVAEPVCILHRLLVDAEALPRFIQVTWADGRQ